MLLINYFITAYPTNIQPNIIFLEKCQNEKPLSTNEAINASMEMPFWTFLLIVCEYPRRSTVTELSLGSLATYSLHNIFYRSENGHGAYIFRTTVYFDCERDAFVYEDGKFWDVPITDSEEVTELGDAKINGSTGSFTFGGDEENLLLEWYSDVTPEETIVFEHAENVFSGA